MVRQGRAVESKADYILGSKCKISQNVAVRYLRYNFDRLMALGCLCRISPREKSCYLKRRTCLPLHLPSFQTRTREEKIFAEFWRAALKLEKRVACHNSWISAETWRLIVKRVSVRLEPGRDHKRIRRL